MLEILYYNDFTLEEKTNGTKSYFINKRITIFNKLTCQEKHYIFLHNNLELIDYILRISNFINWLGIASKNELIKHFHNAMPIENVIDKKWYEEYEIRNITIEIYGQGKMTCTIFTNNDNEQDHHDRELILLINEPL